MPTLFIPANTAGRFGGSYTWLDTLATGLPTFGWRVVIGMAMTSVEKVVEFRMAHPSGEAVVLDSRTGTLLGRRRAIEDAIHSVRPDVVVPLLLADAMPAAAAAKFAGGAARLVYCAHELSEVMMLDVARSAAAVDGGVGVSRLIASVLAEVSGIETPRIARIPYGVPRPVIRRSEQDDASIRIGYAGRLQDDKAVLDFISFCRELDRLEVPYQFDIAGSGEREADLRAGLDEQRRGGRVKFLGLLTRDELYKRAYPSWDCVVLFSPSEGFPISVIEGMVHGTVPIVSDFRGRREERLLRDGQNALVFPVGEPGAAAVAIQRLASDRASLAALSRAAVASSELYTLDVMVEEWDGFLRAIMSLPARRERPASEALPPSGRLDRLFGTAIGERIRRVIAERPRGEIEWPIFYGGETRDVAKTIAAIRERLNRDEESVSPESSGPDEILDTRIDQ